MSEGKKITILYLEDNKLDMELVKGFISNSDLNCQLHYVQNELEYKNCLQKEEIDIILSDYAIPGFSGKEALLLAKEKCAGIPFIYVSGMMGEDVAIESLTAGATDYVLKNNLNRLLPAISRALVEADEKRKINEYQEKLLNNERKFRSLIENSTDGIILLDTFGVIIYQSPSTNIIAGYKDDLSNRGPFSDFVHQDDLNSFLAAFDKVKNSPGVNVRLEFRFKSGYGSYRWFESVAKNMLSDEAINAIVLNFRDISERKQMDQLVLQAIVDTEEIQRADFAANIHDGLGPLISSAKMYLKALDFCKTREEELNTKDKIKETLDEVTTDLRDIANNLSPYILRDYGLIAALEKFSIRVKDTGIDFSLSSELPTRLEEKTEIGLYRIIVESMHNTLKHAEATSIHVSLVKNKSDLTLIYSDNGKGFDIENKLINKKGRGLQNILNRVKALNGKCEFISNINKGMTIKIIIEDE